MTTPMSAREILDREFFEIRASLLGLAASFDRLDRGGEAGQTVDQDPRWERLQQAIDILQQTDPGRAERLQLLFSLPYREDWRVAYQLETTDE